MSTPNDWQERPYDGCAVEQLERDNDWPTVMKAVDETG
jgi:hypothetical protein